MDTERRLRAALKEAADPAGHTVPFEPIEVGARRRRRTKAVTSLISTGILATAGVIMAVTVTSPSSTPIAENPSTPTREPCVPDPMSRPEASSPEFVMIGDRAFRDGNTLLKSDLIGDQIGSVNCTFPTYRAAAMEAIHSTLPAGTRLYAVRGYPPWFRIAAATERGYRLFELSTALSARTGGDLLPLKGKVQSIEIVDDDRKTVVASITDPEILKRVVSAIADAPLVKRTKGQPLFVRFVLRDGTTVRLIPWFPNQAKLDRIGLPYDANRVLRLYSGF